MIVKNYQKESLHVCFLVMHVLVVLSYLANMLTFVAWL